MFRSSDVGQFNLLYSKDKPDGFCRGINPLCSFPLGSCDVVDARLSCSIYIYIVLVFTNSQKNVQELLC